MIQNDINLMIDFIQKNFYFNQAFYSIDTFSNKNSYNVSISKFIGDRSQMLYLRSSSC